MSLINVALWESEFPDRPMPEGCTYEMFHAACEYKDKHHDRQWAADWLAKMQEMYKDPLSTETAKQFAHEQMQWAIERLSED